MREPVSLALSERGHPTVMTWAGVDYRVTDQPTRLEDELFFVTHPPAGVFGWRFQAKPSGGSNAVFDVRFDTLLGQWVLVHPPYA